MLISKVWQNRSQEYHPPNNRIRFYSLWACPHRANERDLAHLQAKTIPMNLIRSEYTHGWWVPASTSFQESLLCMPMGTTIWQDRQMTWRCTSTDQDGFTERESTHGWWIPASATFQESMLCPWARRCVRIGKWHNAAHLQTKTVSLNVNPPMVGEFRHPQLSRSPCYVNGHDDVAG